MIILSIAIFKLIKSIKHIYSFELWVYGQKQNIISGLQKRKKYTDQEV